MYNLEYLFGCLEEDAVSRLGEIFETANQTRDEDKLRALQSELKWILRTGKKIKWMSAPSGTVHIGVVDEYCLLVDVYGVKVLFTDYRFLDGEQDVLNFHWMEEDHLVVFDALYIVRNLVDKCICHYTQEDFFVYLSPVRKLPFEQNDSWSDTILP